MSTPTPTTLFSYCSVEYALHVLTDKCLTWKSPELLSDPFELNSQSGLTFDGEHLLESTIKLATAMIFAPEPPSGDSPLINAINRWRDEQRFKSVEEANAVLRELLGRMVDYRLAQLHNALGRWQEFIRNIRVHSFFADAANLTAWDTLAQNHQGVVFEFNVTEKSELIQTKPVIYLNDRPQLTSLREQMSCILYNRKDVMVERFRDHLYVKSDHRKLEQERRCIQESPRFTPVTDQSTLTWQDELPFDTASMVGIYLGARASTLTKQTIISHLASKNCSKALLYQSMLSRLGYGLKFDPLV